MDWTCPHCGTIQFVTDKAQDLGIRVLEVGPFSEAVTPEFPRLGIQAVAARCAQGGCQKVTVVVALGSAAYKDGSPYLVEGGTFFNRRIYPQPSGKPFPPSVPDPMLADYREAWSIIGLSPKSSATLARRCLQAMIRDFCKIEERTLFHEIEKLEKRLADDDLPKGVEPETVAAMRALKDVGNIGAHMTEVNGVIVDVEPGEAEALLGLIEMLFADWYVARAKRAASLAEIEAIAAAKSGRAAPTEA